MPDMINLHVHSQYSLLDGLDSPETLVTAAKDLGQTAIAITDHGTLSGHRDLQRAAAEHGIKPILGVEAYISPTDRFDKRSIKKRDDNTQVYNHIILLAKNQTGLDNINELSRIAWTEGFYHKPRIDREILKEHAEGVMVLSGCLNGIPAKAILASQEDPDKYQIGLQFLQELKEAFGDDLYVEVQSHNPAEINAGLLDYADTLGLKPVITADCHYARPEDRALQDAFLVLSTNPSQADGQNYSTTKGKDLLERLNALYPDRFMTFQDWNLFVAERSHLIDELHAQDVTRNDIFDNTLEIADKVGKFDFHEGLDLLPSEFDDPNVELESRVFEGLERKGLTDTEYYDRVREEMRVIRKKNFASYFLIVEDLVRWSKSQGILVGPGRGSAAGSLVCHALNITTVDPLKYDLLFARFINEERNDFPDIDLDFEDKRRGEVKEYLRDKYGHVASIATYTYFRDKNAIKDAARVLGVPFIDVKRAMKLVPQKDGLEYYLNYPIAKNDDGTYRDKLAEFKDKFPEVADIAKRLVGRIRGSGMHAGGIVVSKEPIEHYAPIETNKDPDDSVSGRIPLVAYEKDEVESVGLIKLDILGLKSLSVIGDTLRLIEENQRKTISLSEIPLDEPEVYKMLSAGDTVGVFQFDAGASTRLIKEVQPKGFEDIVVATSLVRPGAMDTVGPELLARKNGDKEIEYVHDIMRPFLKNSYGVIIYQEQVMQAAVELGGMSWSKADKLRKIIGKKRDASEFDQYRDEFIEGATKHIDKAAAEQLWHDFEAHAGYSFNRSHAVAYSFISVWTAWLKAMYPIEFMTALLRNEKPGEDKVTDLLIETKRMGIGMLLPHINKSESNYTIEDNKIRFGLSAIKYISPKVAHHIINGRPYITYSDFLDHAGQKYSGINSRAIEHLNKIGAANFKDNPLTGDESSHFYECIGIPKFNLVKLPYLAEEVLQPVDSYDEDETMVISGMVKNIKKGKGWSLVDIVDETGTTSIFDKQNTKMEVGQYYYILAAGKRIMEAVTADEMRESVNGNPVNSLAKYMLRPGPVLIDGKGVYVVKWNPRKTKKGQYMANMVVADKDRNLHDIVVFPSVYGKVFNTVKDGKVVFVKTKLTNQGSTMLVYADKV